MEAIQHMKAAVSEADVLQTARAPNDIALATLHVCGRTSSLDEAKLASLAYLPNTVNGRYLANVLHDGRGQRQEALHCP